MGRNPTRKDQNSQRIGLTDDDSLVKEGEDEVRNEEIDTIQPLSIEENNKSTINIPLNQYDDTIIDLIECDDAVDEDNYNFRMKYRTEMTWQIVYFTIWNFLSRHAWNIWIEFAGVVVIYSFMGYFGSLNPLKYPSLWCFYTVKWYLWLHPLIQIYNALWLARLFFMDSVFWFTYVTMIMNFGVLYCGYVSASEYYENDLISFIQFYLAQRQERIVS